MKKNVKWGETIPHVSPWLRACIWQVVFTLFRGGHKKDKQMLRPFLWKKRKQNCQTASPPYKEEKSVFCALHGKEKIPAKLLPHLNRKETLHFAPPPRDKEKTCQIATPTKRNNLRLRPPLKRGGGGLLNDAPSTKEKKDVASPVKRRKSMPNGALTYKDKCAPSVKIGKTWTLCPIA